MTVADISTTQDDLENCGWEEIVAGCVERTCHTYFSAFAEQASTTSAGGNPRRDNALRLLGAATILMLSEDNKEPFKPLWQIGGQRSTIATDFTDEQLTLFAAFAPAVQDAELQARLADIVWVRKHDHRMALLAVHAYMASARVLEDPDQWPPCIKRIRRSRQIAASLRQEGTTARSR